MALSQLDQRRAEVLHDHGLKFPRTTVEEARRVGLPLSYALAILQKESSGSDTDGTAKFGLNLFGHDPVRNPVRGGNVTRTRYQEYLRHRRAGAGMQGVGPCQLTWWELQDAADRAGGCWHPRYNMRIGFAQAKDLIRRYGKQDAIRRYNGSGRAAEAYARDWQAKQHHWHQALDKVR